MTTRKEHKPTTWLVVNTHPHREALAVLNLERQKFNVYCPMILRRIRHARRAHDARRPLFPGYVFVEIQPGDRSWRPVTSTLGVRSIIWHGDEPGTLKSDFIANLKEREIDGIVQKPGAPFEVGQNVTVQNGPLDGIIGKILEMREKDRMLVLLDMVNQQVKANLHAQVLRPV